MEGFVLNKSRRDLLKEAVHDCLKEMYYRAQPSADWDEYLQLGKEGKIGKNENVWARHYLSKEYADYILDKYITTYRMNNEWKSNLEFLEKDLKEGCTVDKYIKDKIDKNGHYHPGHRGYDTREPLKDRLRNIVVDVYGVNDKLDDAVNRLTDEVFDYIENRKNFYRFDREEDEFKWAVFMFNPSTNKDEVIKYWGKNMNIVDIDPRKFWMIDEGWTEKEMEEELSEIDEEELNKNEES